MTAVISPLPTIEDLALFEVEELRELARRIRAMLEARREMARRRVTISFDPFNHRRSGRPWIARVLEWPVGKRPVFEFGRFLGSARNGGEVEIAASTGDVVRFGQKNVKVNHTDSRWGIVADHGVEIVSPQEARVAWEIRCAAIEELPG